MTGPMQIGDGTATFVLPGGRELTLDLVAFHIWASEWVAPEGDPPFAFTRAAQAYFERACGGGPLTPGQADELISAIGLRNEEVRLFREARLHSLRPSASTS